MNERAHNGEAGAGRPGDAPRKIDPRNRLNDRTGDEWIFFTKTWHPTAYPNEFGHDLRSRHGANKPPRLMQELIGFFTKPGQRVLDPFAGVGGTLLGAALCERRAVGIELNPAWVDVYQQVCQQEELAEFPVLTGDARELLARWREVAPEDFADVEFICTDPPYNLNFKRTMSGIDAAGEYAAHQARKTDYVSFGDEAKDLSNLESYDAFLDAMDEVVRLAFPLLVDGGYLAIILRNAYQEGRYLYTAAHVAERAEAAGFVLKGEKVWYQAGSRLRPYGYPFDYVPNIAHQFILFLQKPRPGKKRKAE